MPAPILKTKRLLLRHWKKTDLPIFAKMNSDPKVMEFFQSLLTRKESDDLTKKIQKELNEKNYGLWAVELPGITPFIGFIGLHYPNFKAKFTPCIEIGWRLDSNYWNKGYATEGAKKALEYGFSVLNLNEIVSFTSHLNHKSIKVMQKLNMKSNPKETFIYPKIPKDSPLNPFVLYRIKKNEYSVKNEFSNISFS